MALSNQNLPSFELQKGSPKGYSGPSVSSLTWPTLNLDSVSHGTPCELHDGVCINPVLLCPVGLKYDSQVFL